MSKLFTRQNFDNWLRIYSKTSFFITSSSINLFSLKTSCLIKSYKSVKQSVAKIGVRRVLFKFLSGVNCFISLANSIKLNMYLKLPIEVSDSYHSKARYSIAPHFLNSVKFIVACTQQLLLILVMLQSPNKLVQIFFFIPKRTILSNFYKMIPNDYDKNGKKQWVNIKKIIPYISIFVFCAYK
ncbi:hypothetical protein BpHYR1_036665 [Brachionus plicatilis]|uniref:Uncharacterized protein n=1 Tax=Brachionus plicatilis TaxID=10195 RepID=A0A3M7PTT0_BRAPC|nr:hypothetical protein BpHYR1_036665 [Brachionus plicatilis]